VISGGGTMNREAAALGVPVYSIFRGKIGAVDQYLADHGRLTLIETVDDLQKKIALVPWSRPASPDLHNRPALKSIVDSIAGILEGTCPPHPPKH
jgi:predicted glycosyltransferase